MNSIISILYEEIRVQRSNSLKVTQLSGEVRIQTQGSWLRSVYY